MIRKKSNRVMAMALALTLMAALAGCSGAGKNSAKLDSMYAQETNRLFNGSDRQRRGLPGVEDDDLAKDSHSLEAQGDNMAMNGDFEGALFVYNRAVLVAEKKQRLRLLAKAGELTLRQGRYAETRGIMETLTKDDPTNANGWQSMGLALLSMNEKVLAEKALEKAVAFNPNLWKSHNALGIIYNHGKQPYKALMAFNKAVQKGPALAELFNNRALAYLLVKNPAQAEADWRRALAIKADFKLAHNNMAILLAKRGNYQEAYSSFAKGSGKAEAHNNMGVMLAWKGNSHKAAKEFDMAMKQLPLYYPKANSHLTQVTASTGRLKGPMVVDLTEDGYLVPADYRVPGPGLARPAPKARSFAKRKTSPEKAPDMLPKQTKQTTAKAPKIPVINKKAEAVKDKKAAPEKKETVIKSKAADAAGSVSKRQEPNKELDLSRFSAPAVSPGASQTFAVSGASLLRARPVEPPTAEPASATLQGESSAPQKPQYAVAVNEPTSDGRSVWRGDIRALFGVRD